MSTGVLPTGLSTTGKIASLYGIRRATVLAAIHAGRIRAFAADADGGRPIFLVDERDADELWRKRRIAAEAKTD